MDVLDWLTAALGDEAIAAGVLTTDPALLDAVRTDRSGWIAEGAPLALVNATRVEHVQATLRAASEFRIPVVPRGAGTGLAGGANGTDGAIVLSVAGMDRIVEISAEDQLAVVEPGVVNSDLNDALEPYGLFFAPDPASRAISTIGGNIATNAGGLLCAKYGVTREAVLALDVVLADGRLIRTGHRTVKGVTGFDLTALFVGSEGTLGVIVGATVRLLPIPAGEPRTLGAIFPDVGTAAAAAARVSAARLRPAVMELIDGPALERISAYLGEQTIADAFGTTGGGSFLLVQFDGPSAAADATAAGALIAESGGTVSVAGDTAEGERLLAIRRAFHPALAASGEVLIEDVAVPRSRMPEMFAAIERISQRYGIPIPTVAHAGDGNLHPNFVYEGEEAPAAVWEAAGDLFRTAVALGGTLTGEHGVGVLKRRWLADELGPDSYELQVKLKSVFDPLGILNPGKVFG
ncbi:FAD-linked oxidase C-terminal domain-containing protein [Leifsonia sp. WHRI 6310E]|uniref:FAD-binding oxidoreductase n=1 Tax=Leifsonia sp. WHRI 6310E TaxID=3162562 RepID=UPI0032EBB594